MEFYRYEMRRYASQYSDYLNEVKVELVVLNLHKETPRGYWIGYGSEIYASGQQQTLKGNSKWVSKTGRKRYAYPTKEEAKHNFVKRIEKRIRILETQLSDSKECLNLINVII